MAKESFGEYSAFTTQGGIRFQSGNKLIAQDTVPPEVVSYLRSKLGVPEEQPKFPRPTPEEITRLKEESLRVPVELARSDAEMEAVRGLTAEDFPAEYIQPDRGATPNQGSEPLPSDPDIINAQVRPKEALEPNSVNTSATGKAIGREIIDTDFMDSISIYTAPLESLVQALYDRFGIYTVYLNQFPQNDEINPLTGEGFTKYHLGIAYQAAIRASNQGLFDRNPVEGRRLIDEGRQASEDYQSKMVPEARTMNEARDQNSFAYRTSVKGMNEAPDGNPSGTRQHYDKEEDEIIAEPRIGGAPIIRPNW